LSLLITLINQWRTRIPSPLFFNRVASMPYQR
jgi:hypothetical protein